MVNPVYTIILNIKCMKRLYFALILLSLSAILCQATMSQISTGIGDARLLLDGRNPACNPAKALTILRPLADAGNAEAMNMTGVILSRGLCDSIDYNSAFGYFSKSADGGYANAWNNLGMMYKNGTGTAQDMAKAYECFSRGVDAGSVACMYSKGFMLYKGLGCEQNYEQAVALFKSSIPVDIASMYMLGICYRNGYGITQNTDSARYWLTKAAQWGYAYAKDELQAKEAENEASANTAQKVKRNSGTSTSLPSTYNRVKHAINQRTNIAGEYTGYIVRYDWSGKHVIGQSALKLTLTQQGDRLTGVWVEGDSLRTDLSAQLTDSTVTFDNTGYNRTDHYNSINPNKLSFRNASLSIVRQGNDTVHLGGNLQLYSTVHNEPEKPIYIALSKTGVIQSPIQTQHLSDNEGIRLKAYPNPFNNTCNISFNLPKTSEVELILTDVSGRLVLKNKTLLQAGEQTQILQESISNGCYILKLCANGQTSTTIIIKQ